MANATLNITTITNMVRKASKRTQITTNYALKTYDDAKRLSKAAKHSQKVYDNMRKLNMPKTLAQAEAISRAASRATNASHRAIAAKSTAKSAQTSATTAVVNELVLQNIIISPHTFLNDTTVSHSPIFNPTKSQTK